MAFCSECGSELKKDAKFCSSCGTKLGDSPNSQETLAWPDLSTFGDHPITLGKFLESSPVKRLSKYVIKGIEKNLGGALE